MCSSCPPDVERFHSKAGKGQIVSRPRPGAVPVGGKSPASSVWAYGKELYSYRPEHDRTDAVRFSMVAKTYPDMLSGPRRGARTGVSNFAEIGYCAYKAWHHGRGSETRWSDAMLARMQLGAELHEEKESALLEQAALAPRATAAQVADPMVDLVEIPEFPARTKIGKITYSARIDAASRSKGALVIGETKSGSYTRAPQHFLQTWAYCLAAPAAMKRFEPKFKAREIYWYVDYPEIEETCGPFRFTKRNQELVLGAMKIYEWLHFAGAKQTTAGLGGLPNPTPRKCPPCAFNHACEWKK